MMENRGFIHKGKEYNVGDIVLVNPGKRKGILIWNDKIKCYSIIEIEESKGIEQVQENRYLEDECEQRGVTIEKFYNWDDVVKIEYAYFA